MTPIFWWQLIAHARTSSGFAGKGTFTGPDNKQNLGRLRQTRACISRRTWTSPGEGRNFVSKSDSLETDGRSNPGGRMGRRELVVPRHRTFASIDRRCIHILRTDLSSMRDRRTAAYDAGFSRPQTTHRSVSNSRCFTSTRPDMRGRGVQNCTE